MSSPRSSVVPAFCARILALPQLAAIALSPLAVAVAPPQAIAATAGKTYFFATRDACAASGAFSSRECAAAFANAKLQLRDRAPRFSTAGECRLRFRLCEMTRADVAEGEAMSYAPPEAAVFTPIALGVEMVASARGAMAAPTLAIETPARLFPYFPISRLYEARVSEVPRSGTVEENAAIPAADRFEPFSKRKPVEAASSFTASAFSAIEDSTRAASSETPEERRARLKNAPFVE
jgi:hypothetical protein